MRRTVWMQLLVAATVFALIAPVMASGEEIQRKDAQKGAPKKDDMEGLAKLAGPEKAADEQDKDAEKSEEPKKNCPIDGKFNTMEDMFGADQPASVLAIGQPSAGAAPAGAAAAQIEWRALDTSAVAGAAADGTTGPQATGAEDEEEDDNDKDDDTKKEKEK